MDPLSFAASLIAVGTLALQCGNSLRTAIGFWSSIQDAPHDIRQLAQESSLLANVFDRIEQECTTGNVPQHMLGAYTEVLKLANDELQGLTEITNALSSKLASSDSKMKRQWRKFQITSKDERISKIKSKLECLKSTINLLQTQQALAMMSQLHINSNSIIAQTSTIANTLSTPSSAIQPSTVPTNRAVMSPILHNSTNTTTTMATQNTRFQRGIIKKRKSQVTSTINFLLGTVSLRTTSSVLSANTADNETKSEDQTDSHPIVRTSYVLQLMIGFTTCRRGFKVSTTDNFDGLVLNPVRRRRDGSEIFKLCVDGDVDGVESLILSGDASVHDVNEEGWSLLHYACFYQEPELCKMLIACGIDVWLTNDLNWTAPRVRKLLPAGCLPVIYEAGYFSFEDEIWPTGISGIADWNFAIHHALEYGTKAALHGLLGAILLRVDMFEINDYVEATFLIDTYMRFARDPRYTRKFDIVSMASLLQDSWFRPCLWLEVNPGLQMKIRLISQFVRHLPQLFNQNHVQLSCVYGCMRNFGNEKMGNPILDGWLMILSASGVDLGSYAKAEMSRLYAYPQSSDDESQSEDEFQSDHKLRFHGELPSTHKLQFKRCCRVFQVDFDIGEGPRDVHVRVESTISSEFADLDPSFLCSASSSRTSYGSSRCLSLVDRSSIGDGKPIMNIPGQWDQMLKPNDELNFSHRSVFGFKYTDSEANGWVVLNSEQMKEWEEEIVQRVEYAIANLATET